MLRKIICLLLLVSTVVQVDIARAAGDGEPQHAAEVACPCVYCNGHIQHPPQHALQHVVAFGVSQVLLRPAAEAVQAVWELATRTGESGEGEAWTLRFQWKLLCCKAAHLLRCAAGRAPLPEWPSAGHNEDGQPGAQGEPVT